jgi:hypothetical protein
VQFTDVDSGHHLDPRVCEMRRNIEIELQQAACFAELGMGRIENYRVGEIGQLRDSGKAI